MINTVVVMRRSSTRDSVKNDSNMISIPSGTTPENILPTGTAKRKKVEFPLLVLFLITFVFIDLFFKSNVFPPSKSAGSEGGKSLGLGPKGTSRQYFRYYDSLYYAAMQFASDANSAIEVGCAADPFLKHLDWVDNRVCVAPYFVQYDKPGESFTTRGKGKEIRSVQADFMEYNPPRNEVFDLLLCSQVLEHVPNPAAFMKKLITTAKVSIIAVPYDWKPCGESCNHVTNHITYDMLLEWSAPFVPIFSSIVIEKHNEQRGVGRRIIVVFDNSHDEPVSAINGNGTVTVI